MKAIISDIHSNLEALQAVLEDIASQNVTEIYCLGDIIGYGPNPRECIDLVMKCQMVLLGNHDQGAMFDPDGFNPPAERAIFWTRCAAGSRPAKTAIQRRNAGSSWPSGRARFKRKRLSLRSRLGPQSAQRIRLPRRHLQSAQDGRIFALVERYCFQGHTHVPGVFHRESISSKRPRRSITPTARRPQDAVQRRLGRPAARRRLGGPATSCSTTNHHASAASNTTSTHDEEDLRHPRPREFPRRSPARRTLSGKHVSSFSRVSLSYP